MARGATATKDPEDAALLEREELSEIRRQIAAEKAKLAEIQKQSAQKISGKQISPEQAALQKELKDLNRKRAAHLKAQVDWAAAGKKGMPPHYLTPLSGSVDGSAIPLDPATGKSPVPEGMLPVWIGCYDRSGRDNADPPHVRLRLLQGYQKATFDDGTEVRDSGLGLLMYASPKQAAEWTERAMPKGAISPAEYAAASMELEAATVNRQAGTEALRIRRFKEHGDYKTMELVETETESEFGNEESGSDLYQA